VLTKPRATTASFLNPTSQTNCVGVGDAYVWIIVESCARASWLKALREPIYISLHSEWKEATLGMSVEFIEIVLCNRLINNGANMNNKLCWKCIDLFVKAVSCVFLVL
jgi:hypothetical protein